MEQNNTINENTINEHIQDNNLIDNTTDDNKSQVIKPNRIRLANLLFLSVVVISLCANLFVSLMEAKGIELHFVANLIISQTIILLPGLLFFLYMNKGSELPSMYRRIRPISALLLIVLTWLLMPLVTAANVLSQLFTTNEVVNLSGEIIDMPVVLMVLIIGFVGPFSEEFVFRGIIYNSFAKQSERYILSGIISGLFFGLMHMNLNQFCYAFVLGVLFAIINEILESTWASFVCHAVVNTQNVLLLFITNKIVSQLEGMSLMDAYGESQNALGVGETGGSKLLYVAVFVVLLCISVVTTALAGLLLYGISSCEGRKERFKRVLNIKRAENGRNDENNKNIEAVSSGESTKSHREKILYPTGMIAIGICIFVIFLLEPLINLLK